MSSDLGFQRRSDDRGVYVLRKKCILRFLPIHGRSDMVFFVRNRIVPGITLHRQSS